MEIKTGEKMNRLESNSRGTSSSGRSRMKGADKNSRGRASGERGTSRTGSSYDSRHQQAGRRNAVQTARRNSSYHRRKGPDYKKIALFGAGLLILIAVISLFVKFKGGSGLMKETTEESTPAETQMKKEVQVEGVSITGMSRTQAKNAILQEYPWSMTVAYNGDVYQVENLMDSKIETLLDEIYAGEPESTYSFNTDGLEDAAKAQAEACAAKWDKKAQNGAITSFDAEKNKFIFGGGENGFAINKEKLASDILAALKEKRFDAEIQADGSEVAPEMTAAQAQEKYKKLSSFTTDTTANANRNTNVRLSAEALNGTILAPGEEFSFNGVVGQRTPAKGYKEAAAYNNGEVVQETGGGVCQISTTLYNAVYRAGLEITYRRSHTFEPSYITPGQDATVSWEQPDFKFRNNTSSTIGIKASYADRKANVTIYGIPVLEEGVTWDLVSEKVETLDKPAPVYEEDQTLQPGVEVEKSAGSSGSRWHTYKVVYKDGKEVSRELDHKTTYKGHAPVIRRNTTGVVLNPEETTTVVDTTVPTVDGMPEGYVPEPGDTGSVPEAPGSDSVTGEGGPGVVDVPSETKAEAAQSPEAESASPVISPIPQ